MASSSLTSWEQGPSSPSEKKEESFLDKLGSTLTWRKKTREVGELAELGRLAIDAPMRALMVNMEEELQQCQEGEEKSIVEERAKHDPKLQELIALLMNWVNNKLVKQRIIVRDLEQDFYDGQVLQKLVEKLAGVRLAMREVEQSERGQKKKLHELLHVIDDLFQGHGNLPWSVELIHSKNLAAILHLLVALARQYDASIRIPENVTVPMIVVTRRGGVLEPRRVLEDVTTPNDNFMVGGRFGERDAFDTLFDRAPERLGIVKKTLVTFVNKHLNKINLNVTDIEAQFGDGVYLVMLMGLLDGYFVPLYHYHLTPSSREQMIHNVSFAFELMEDAGLEKPKSRAEDIVNLDLKSTLRVLYNLFMRYKSVC